MAYYANGSEGEILDEQCAECRFGREACPISLVQGSYNSYAGSDQIIAEILNILVRDGEGCQMFKTFQKYLKVVKQEKSPFKQLSLDL